jgi:uncharacterized membrane protein
MAKFVAFTFPDHTKIDDAVRVLKNIQAERRIKLYGSAVIAKDDDGKLSVQEITKEGHGGTLVGLLIGALAGLPVGPAAAAIVATGGAAIGIAADHSAEHDFEKFANKVADNMLRAHAAIVADFAEDDVPAFKATMQGLGASVLL